MDHSKNLVLIRARHLAESVTTPMFLTDAAGNMIYYNEPAEAVLGRPFSAQGPLDVEEWQKTLDVRDKDGAPFPLQDMPGWLVLQRHRPTLGHVRFRSFDGTDRYIALCGTPLFTHPDRFEGALVLFWEDEED